MQVFSFLCLEHWNNVKRCCERGRRGRSCEARAGAGDADLRRRSRHGSSSALLVNSPDAELSFRLR